MNASIMCIKTTDRALFPLSVSQETVAHQTVMTHLIRGPFLDITHIYLLLPSKKNKKTKPPTHTHTITQSICKIVKKEKHLSLVAHHSNPSKAMHALADGGQVVEEW